ncbi:MAG: metal-dependent transcriptional regulator [Flavobacteriales bacterium]|nr:metal-dependent transcriptional regulator [Flavobacteriales bacterium]MDG1779717.1 metal-dependent transcriptional regulator [Flavobacteriales bacterium]
MASQTVENYLKCIYALQQKSGEEVATNAIAERLETKASSVTDMLKKLKAKDLVDYQKYKGATLTKEGQRIAIDIIRRHRLWEVFLTKELNFSWDEVHDIAEELEHVESPQLIKRLDAYLGNPKYDPHGDPIPDEYGNLRDERDKILLSNLELNQKGIVIGVGESSSEYLQYLDSIGLTLGTSISVLERFPFDNSVKIKLNNQEFQVSLIVAQNLVIKPQ